MWEGSSTEGDNIHKLVGLGCMRVLPAPGTLTKQDSKPGDNVCPRLDLQFVASLSTLSYQSGELWSDRSIHNNHLLPEILLHRIPAQKQNSKLEQQQQMVSIYDFAAGQNLCSLLKEYGIYQKLRW